MRLSDLERELETLAAAREDDDRLRLAIRAKLVERPEPRPSRRISRRLVLALAASAATAAVALALLGTGSSGGPSPADAAILRHAIRAVTPPPHRILHVEVAGVQNASQIAAEFWQETSPPYANRGIKGPVGHQGEAADDGTTTFEYDPATNTITARRDATPPSFADPISQVRHELQQRQAQVSGTVTIDGASLYRIDLPNGLVGYFDQKTYAPRYLDDPQRGGGTVRLKVVTYEYLASTAATRALLSITAQHPNARLETTPSAAGVKP